MQVAVCISGEPRGNSELCMASIRKYLPYDIFTHTWADTPMPELPDVETFIHAFYKWIGSLPAGHPSRIWFTKKLDSGKRFHSRIYQVYNHWHCLQIFRLCVCANKPTKPHVHCWVADNHMDCACGSCSALSHDLLQIFLLLLLLVLAHCRIHKPSRCSKHVPNPAASCVQTTPHQAAPLQSCHSVQAHVVNSANDYTLGICDCENVCHCQVFL